MSRARPPHLAARARLGPRCGPLACLLLACLLLAPRPALREARASEDEGGLAPEQRVTLRLLAPRTQWWAGEVLALDLVLACDRAWLEQHGVALFRQPASLPLLLRAPGLDQPVGRAGPGGLVRLPDPGQQAGPASLRLALGDEVVAAERLPDDPARPGWLQVRVRRLLHAPLPADGLRLAAPSVEFAHAARFTQDVLGNRVPHQPQRVRSEGTGLALTVKPLPEAGRPAGFDGWIGTYALEPEALPSTVLAGGTPLRLVLRVVGEGNEAVRPPPRIATPEGWRLLGLLDGRDARGRMLTLDLLPEPAPTQSATRELPALCIATFDPQAGTYAKACAPRLAVQVEAAAGPATPEGPPVAPVPSPSATPPREQRDPATSPATREPRTWLVVLAGLACGAGLALWRLRRRAQAALAAPAQDAATTQRAALAEAEALLQACARAQPPRPDALLEGLALWQGCTPAALVTPDLAARLVRQGWPAGLAAQAAAAVEARVAARYAGPVAPSAQDLVAREAALATLLLERLRETRNA